MHLIPCVTVSYCKYGYYYQKHTMIWGTVQHYAWRPKCRRDCEDIQDGRHVNWAQKAGKRGKPGFTQVQLYSMPMALCQDIVCAALQVLKLPPNELYI